MPNLQFGTYDEETAAQEKADCAAGSAQFYKFKVGRNILRILPPPPGPGQKSPYKTVFQHFIQMPGGSKSVICSKAARTPCPVCDHVAELRKSKLAQDQQVASDLFARRRVFANVIDRADEAAGPKVAAFGKTIHEQLSALRNDKLAGADYLDPENGFDVIIERTGSGKNDTEYDVRLARKSTPLQSAGDLEVMQEWIDNQHDLAAFARLPSPAEIRALLTGEDPAEEEDEEADASPPRHQAVRAAPAGRASAPRAAAAPASRGAASRPRAAGPVVAASGPVYSRARAGSPVVARQATARRNAEDDAIDVDADD
jgi:hypothetical protein